MDAKVKSVHSSGKILFLRVKYMIKLRYGMKEIDIGNFKEVRS